MKTQISRNSFKAEKRYAGVYQQQGRMLTDADWNNLVDVLKGHLAEALKDVAGTGSPRNGALTIDTADLTIIPGDLYVDGLRASLPGAGNDRIPVTDQPDFPDGPDLPDPAVGPYVVYADVWERSLTALEDPDLRDAGLNGADTGTRTQTMLQVKICPEGVDPEIDIPRHGDAALALELHGNRESGDPCNPCAGQIDAGEGHIGNYLFRLEVHRFKGTAADPTRLTLKWSSENGAEQYAAQSETLMPPGFVNSRYMYEFFNLTTEKHPGVHLAPGFNPIPGILKPAYEIPDGILEPKEFVRRWDGYCELIYNGSAWRLAVGWDKGVNLSTTVADTAPGYVSLGSSMTVNLEALELKLVLGGRTFVPGDYWLAPVREAEHLPGDVVSKDALPEGIVHHYLRLARVEADGSVQLFDDDADERRHNFPPLNDLLAHDVGYLRDQANCTNSLFDATHDNVEKALNRICELAAEHIDYQADCSQGLFQGFEGTVKGALDKVCTIQAEDVGFSKPCDTGFFKGQTVTTVADALGLLCDVQTGGGCKVTVGEGGVFNTLEEAIKELQNRGQPHICLCLLPGRHRFGGTWKKELDRFNLSITGCGAGTKVILENPLEFIGLTSLKLENFAMDSMAQNFPLTVRRCTEVDIINLHHVGLAKENPLIRVTGGERVRLEENILEAYTTIGLEKPQKVFDFDPGLADLYALPGRDDFFARVGEKAEEWAALHQNQRRAIAFDILSRLEASQNPPENIRFTMDEDVAYRHLAEALALIAVNAQALDDRLREIRDQAHHAAAGVGLVFMDALASVSLGDNTILGSVSFYGDPGANLSDGQVGGLAKMLAPPAEIRFSAYRSSLQVWDNRITRLAVGDGMVKTLQDLITTTGDKLPVQVIYRTAQFESNIIFGSRNQILFENLTLAANEFQTLVEPVIGWVVGKTAIYTGNRVGRATYSDLNGNEITVGSGRMQTAVSDRAIAANLPKDSW